MVLDFLTRPPPGEDTRHPILALVRCVDEVVDARGLQCTERS